MELYLTLGLQPSASAGDIRRAYRRLARRYHPELNPGDREAELRFQRIVEAYETLSDPERRRQYDTGGAPPLPGPPPPEAVASFAFEGFDFTARVQGASAPTFGDLFADVVRAAADSVSGEARGADLHAELHVPFAAVLDGLVSQFVVTRRVRCAMCAGAGRVDVVGGRCGECAGSGVVRSARGHMVFSKPCPRCEGSGAPRHVRCQPCAGEGVLMRSDPVSVKVPAGVRDGEQLRLAGLGNAGRRGAPDGDLLITVHVDAHPLFRREGDDLLIEVPIAVHEAAFGAKIEVPSLAGPCRLRVPPGTQSGQQFRLRERGIPNGRTGRPGDLVATVRLVLPPLDDEASRALVRALAQAYPDDVRKDLRV